MNAFIQTISLTKSEDAMSYEINASFVRLRITLRPFRLCFWPLSHFVLQGLRYCDQPKFQSEESRWWRFRIVFVLNDIVFPQSSSFIWAFLRHPSQVFSRFKPFKLNDLGSSKPNSLVSVSSMSWQLCISWGMLCLSDRWGCRAWSPIESSICFLSADRGCWRFVWPPHLEIF